MTPGMVALAEAAKLERARVYGATCPEQGDEPSEAYYRLLGEAQALEQRHAETHVIEQALRAGRQAPEIVDLYGVDYATVRAVRKRLMRGAA